MTLFSHRRALLVQACTRAVNTCAGPKQTSGGLRTHEELSSRLRLGTAESHLCNKPY